MPTKTESKQLENQHPHEDNATQYTPRTPTSHVQEGQFIPSRPAPKPPSTPLSSMSVSHKTPSSQSLPRSDSQSDIRSSTPKSHQDVSPSKIKIRSISSKSLKSMRSRKVGISLLILHLLLHHHHYLQFLNQSRIRHLCQVN